MKTRLPVIVPIFVALLGGQLAAADPLRDDALGRFAPIPEVAPPLAGEAPAPEKLAVSKMLYFDPRLSEKQDMSCNSCHNLALGGASGHGSLGGRLTPTVLNAVFNKAQFWDGRASDLREQVVMSVMVNPAALLVARGGAMTPNTAEMNIAKQHAVERLKSIPGYAAAFKKAFPGEADPITMTMSGGRSRLSRQR